MVIAPFEMVWLSALGQLLVFHTGTHTHTHTHTQINIRIHTHTHTHTHDMVWLSIFGQRLMFHRAHTCFSHKKHFPGGGEVTEDLVKWASNMAEQRNYLILITSYKLPLFQIMVASHTHIHCHNTVVPNPHTPLSSLSDSLRTFENRFEIIDQHTYRLDFMS